MKGILRNHPYVFMSIMMLLIVGGVLVTYGWIWVPELYLGWVERAVNCHYVIPLMIVACCLFLALIYLLWQVTYGALVVFALMALLEVGFGTLIVHRVISLQIHDYVQQLVDQTANLARVELDSRLRSRLFALNRLANEWRVRHGQYSQEQWEEEVGEVLQTFPGFQAIEWVDSDFKMQWVVLADEDDALKQRYLKIKSASTRAILPTKKVKHFRLSNSVNLVQGGRGVLIYLPLYVEDQFQGFLIGVVSYEKLFNTLFAKEMVPGYSMAAYVDKEKVFQRGSYDEHLYQQWGHDVFVNFEDVKFYFKIWPTASLVGGEHRIFTSAIFFIGVLLGLLVLLATFITLLMQRYAQRMERTNFTLRREMRERHTAEKAREQMRLALMQSQKLEAIGTLAGGIAHNFNNILYSIKGYAQLARDDADPTSIQHRNLGKVVDATGRGQDLVKGILSFSRQESYEFKSIKVWDVIYSTLGLLKSTLPSTIEIQTAIEVENERIHGNHTQLQQVLMNIIQNSVDAINGVGIIDLRASVDVLGDKVKRHYPRLSHAEYIFLTIRDDGVGIDREVAQRIFEPFFTTKDVGKGTGLGLSTSRSIVHDHEGEILVDSEPGKGTTFTILLPLLIDEPEAGTHG